jgi:hypothetical protein
MKNPWEEIDNEVPEALDAILTGLLVIAVTLICAGLLGLGLGVVWGWVE